MSFLARTVEGVTVPYSEAQLRADFPDVSFPADLAAADLSEFGCFFSDDYSEDQLAGMEALLLAGIDRQAGAFRRRFITDVPGQAQTYAEKEREALAFAEDSEGDYPFLSAEAAARGLPVADIATEVAATAAAWRLLGAAIEGARMGAKQAVRKAASWDDKQAAAVVDWSALIS